MNKGAAAVLADDAAIEELRAMSAAAIDRYLRGARKGLEPLAKSATRRSSCALRNEIPFGTSHAPVDRPGHLSIDTVAHCGSTLKGDCLWTLNSMDVLTGWTETVTVRNKTARWVRHGHEEILPAIPFKVLAANYDGGSEFINAETAGFSKLMHYQMTRSRPYRSNDNAHVEQRNGDAVRRYDFRYRYEDAEATGVLNRLWYWASLRKNYLVPWRKCVGHTKTRSGRTRGACDSPKTPCQRALESGHVSAEKKAEAEKTLKGLNDAHVTRKINELQHALLGILSDKAMLEFVDEAVRAVTAA
ncbi:MAG: transposase family protein [Coriobacteriales bacterium]|nr:transposase family protein [Coriobacteriales bacterium]